MHRNTYQHQIFQKPTCLPKQEAIRVTGLNCLCDVCLSETKRWSEWSWREAKDDMTLISALLSLQLFSHKGIFLVSYRDSLGAWCGGAGISHLQRTNSLHCTSAFCGRPRKKGQTLSQMSVVKSSIFVRQYRLSERTHFPQSHKCKNRAGVSCSSLIQICV